MDLGVNTSLNKVWNISLAVTDIGKINWKENTELISYTGQYYVTDLSQSSPLDSLSNKFKETKDSTGSFSTGLLTAIRVGASYFLNLIRNKFPGTFLFAFDYNRD